VQPIIANPAGQRFSDLDAHPFLGTDEQNLEGFPWN
jgi:hypothetical protein